MIRLAFLLVLSASLAFCHEGESLRPHDLWRAWELDPGIVLPAAVSGLLYARGATARHGVSIRERVLFWSGWTVLVAALVSPLHPLGEVLFSVHMTQHELLMVVAAPLLVLSRPSAALLWGLPSGWRRPLGLWSKRAPVRGTWRFLTHPMSAWWIHAAALWLWHIPVLFEATLRSDVIHSAQHLSFLGSALLFWWSLFHAHGSKRYGESVLYLFTTGVHTSILGALLTFAPNVWYPAYIPTAPLWGLSPLQDQQLGGLIMWIPAGLAYLIGGLVLFAEWLRVSDRSADARAVLRRGAYAR